MTWTYTAQPDTNLIDGVRFKIGDTDVNNQILQDEEIQALLNKNSNNVLLAALECARAIYARFSRYASEKVGDISIDYRNRAAEYKNLIQVITDEINNSATPIPYAGGISVEDVAQVKADVDRPERYFEVGFMDDE